jgi:2-iminobutanoate/2-iminopropanoate deaminase
MRRIKILTLAIAASAAAIFPAFPQAKQIIAPPGLLDPRMPFSPGVRSGDLLYVAGTMGTANGAIAAGGIEAQTKKSLENIGAVLKANGMDYKDVVAVNVFLADSREFDRMNTAYREVFKKNPPVRATVESDLIAPDALVEISAIAVRPDLPRQIINPPGWAPTPLFSKAIAVGDYIFLGGLVSQDPKTGRPVDGDVKVQTKQIMDNAKVLVEMAGFKMSDITTNRIWLSDSRDLEAMNGPYNSYFTELVPGSVHPTRLAVRSRLMMPVYKVQIMPFGIRGRKEGFNSVDTDREHRLANLSTNAPGTAALKVGNQLYIPGVRVNDAQVRGDVKAQTRAILMNIQNLLKQGGMDFENVVSAQIWITDSRNIEQVNEVYKEFMKGGLPSGTAVGVGLMSADNLVQIGIVAAK